MRDIYQLIEESVMAAPNSNRADTGIFNCAEKASRFSNEGALIPRSIRLRKSTEMPRSSANCSWLILLAKRIDLSRWPNRSRKFDN